MKIIEDSLRDLWDNNKGNNIGIIGDPEEEETKKRDWENISRDCSWKLPLYGKRNSQSGPGITESAIQEKIKEKHAKTHINQTIKY